MEGEKMRRVEKRHYDKQFKREAVRLANDPKRKVKDVAQELGIHPNMLSKWKMDAKRGVSPVASGHNIEDTGARDARVLHLERTVAALEEERDILKKAVRIFSKDQDKSTGSLSSIGNGSRSK